MPSLSRYAVVLVALPLAFGACKKKPPVVAPTQAAPTQAPPASQPSAPATTPSRPAPVDNSAEENKAKVRRLLLETVYFEYDSDEIRADARTSLEARLPLLNANPQVKLKISGHCDERGTDEYNISLGRRRAEAVKRFLTDRGIDASRVETVSFGRERPAVQGDTEAAWSRNRRDEFEITAGGDMLRVP